MNPTEPVSVPEPQKIGKFKASRMLVGESFNILKHDRELAWFPVLSAMTSTVVLVIFAVAVFFSPISEYIQVLGSENNQQLNAVGYIVLFVYYLLAFFITNYFLAGIYTIVHGRFGGKDLSFKDGIANANKHIVRIFTWSLISATVGIVLQIISDKSKIIGKIVSAIFGAAWAILTYFSLPSLVIGERSIKESFKESASVIRKTWGETIIVNFGVGLFFGLVTMLVIVIMIGVAILMPVTETFIVLGVLLAIYIIALSIVSSTLGSIIKCALYEYATTGAVPQGFTPELIKGSVKARK